MKAILPAALAATLIVSPAFAADMPVKAPAPPVAAPVDDWTGFYIGANAGAGQNRSGFIYEPPGLPFTGVVGQYSAIGSGTMRREDFIGGGQLGYNYQWNVIVLGVEADIDYFHNSASFSNVGTPPGNVQLTSLASVSTDWLATVRGRVGVAIHSLLFYLTAGGAGTNFNFNQANTYAGLGTERVNISGTRWAGVYGGGVEYLVSRNWSVKAEYLHADFGTESRLVPFANFAGLHLHSADLGTDIVRAGVNYKFDYTGAPLVAKY